MSLDNQIRLEINWFYMIALLVIVIGFLGVIGWIPTAQVLKETLKGLPISGGFSWPIVIGLDLICILCILSFIWKVYCTVQTKFDNEGISCPGLFGQRVIRWAEVSREKG